MYNHIHITPPYTQFLSYSQIRHFTFSPSTHCGPVPDRIPEMSHYFSDAPQTLCGLLLFPAQIPPDSIVCRRRILSTTWTFTHSLMALITDSTSPQSSRLTLIPKSATTKWKSDWTRGKKKSSFPSEKRLPVANWCKHVASSPAYGLCYGTEVKVQI